MAENALHKPFDITALEIALGYKGSSFYGLDAKSLGSRRLLQRARSAGVKGVYLFQVTQKRSQPAVFLASANTPQQAKAIHRSLWNMGNAPFVIIVLPDQIRVYSGFQYSSEKPETGLLKTIQQDSLDVLGQVLIDFQAASINSGAIWQSQPVREDGRVDRSLLNALEKLSKLLRRRGLFIDTANKLIGKSIFFRYLIDRQIITVEGLNQQDINLASAFSRNATLPAFRKLVCFLEARFNGSIFPIDFDQELITDEHISLVAGTLMGDEVYGDDIQLHLDFKAFDFQYIAIETLSSIYERFVRTEDLFKRVPKSQGKAAKKGIVYTPEFLAGYLMEEMEITKPLQAGMKVIDPSCGSGVFLVLAYRKLIEIANQATIHDPEVLKEILITSVFGIEREEGACCVTELSLILTLLDHLQPDDLKLNPNFKFPSLRNSNIFHGDFFDHNHMFWKRELRFDWVIGNPPWTDLKGMAASEETPFREWMKTHKSENPVGDTRISEGFLWRAPTFLNQNGLVGLIVHAKSLTNHKSQIFRNGFFSNHRIHRVTNFANLRHALFSGRATSPAAILVYQPGKPDADATVTHFSPFLANQEPFKEGGQLWTLAVSSSEVQVLPQQLIAKGTTSTWKAAMWGHCETHLRNIERIRSLCPLTLDSLCDGKQWDRPLQGPEFQPTKTGKMPEVPEIRKGQQFRLIDFSKPKLSPPLTYLSKDHFELVPVTDFWLRRGEIRNPACMIFIHPSWTRQVFSKDSFVVRSRQISLGGPDESEAHLRALTLYLNSSLVRYYLFFHVPDWGIERDRITLKEVRKIPVPEMNHAQIQTLARKQRELVRREQRTPFSPALFKAEVDRSLAETLAFPQELIQTAQEFFDVTFTLHEGRTKTVAVENPSHEQLQEYGQELATELDDFLMQDNIYHRIHLMATPHLILCTISLEAADAPISVKVENGEIDFDIALLSEKHGQWAYIRRNLRLFEPDRIRMIKPSRLMDWTRTQARCDAGDIFAEARASPKRSRRSKSGNGAIQLLSARVVG